MNPFSRSKDNDNESLASESRPQSIRETKTISAPKISDSSKLEMFTQTSYKLREALIDFSGDKDDENVLRDCRFES